MLWRVRVGLLEVEVEEGRMLLWESSPMGKDLGNSTEK